MRSGEPDRSVKETVYLVPVHGKRCAAICHSQPGLKLTEFLIEGGQVREIFRQRIIGANALFGSSTWTRTGCASERRRKRMHVLIERDMAEARLEM